jgi:cytochrome c1
MKRVIIVVAILLLTFSIAFAAGPKTYQVTGPVLEVKDDSIIVQKGKEKWQIARDKDTKIKGDLKVGAKVTIEYTMKAVAVEVKGESKKVQPKNK